MSKNTILWTIVIVLVIGIGIYALNKKSTETNVQQPASTSTSTQQSANGNPQAQTAAIAIKNFAFNPATVTINKGTTVIWTNQDSVAHRIKSGYGFNSNNLNPGDAYHYQFNEAGTFDYICGIHPYMHGTVIVR
ncbi:MAG TPA: cupredoxin domain-containing protein [Candidatus Paceibacterota bacterium]